MPKDAVDLATDIVTVHCRGGDVPIELYLEAANAGINIPALLEMAEELNKLSEPDTSTES